MDQIKIPEWNTYCNLVQEVSELPLWFDNENLYLDVETTSEKDKEKSINPWHNCKLLGIALVVDEEPCPYYIPLRHRGANHYKNLPIEPTLNWLQKVLNGSKKWINHNIKYDAHVLTNEGVNVSKTRMVDSIVLCKLAPREERYSYTLNEMMRLWFYKPIEQYEEKLHICLGGKKDYGLVPIDRMAPYAGVDTLAVRVIAETLREEIPEECYTALGLEIELTPILFEMECIGAKLDMELLGKHDISLPASLFGIEGIIQKKVGFDGFRPHTNADCKLLICDHWGLPVIEWTEKKKPSFGSDAILGYKAMDSEHEEIYDWILKYKELHKLYTGFTQSYLDLQVNGIVHCDYNQIVRTGRTSCRKPNMQQLSPDAKAYIIPFDKDRKLVDIDYSQIEFRLIAHFIQAEKILKEYAENPQTDYHQSVANICGIDRKPAKNINFMMAYGGGRGKCVQMLAAEPSIILELKSKKAMETKANDVYERYHKMMPTLKKKSYEAQRVMRRRNYVKTIMGRQRRLPRKAQFKAFNSVIQGSAADLWKAALVRAGNYIKGTDVKLIAAVHDSFVFDMPKDRDITDLINVIEEIPNEVNLRVPICADAKESTINWKECE
jgi:DNA polymerase-1